MITLFCTDINGNTVYTYQSQDTEKLEPHLKIAKEVLDKREDIQYIAIILQTAHLSYGNTTAHFDITLLHLMCRATTPPEEE